MNWQISDTAAIPRCSPNEAGLVRAWVLENADGYEMWFCSRGRYDDADSRARNYRLGYATSKDALTWSRNDALQTFVNPPKPGDWDAEMQCYPCVARYKGDDYLFYCGNGYGVAGFGYAKRVRTDMHQANG